MAGRKLEKAIERALENLERWLAGQPSWKSGGLTNASGRSSSGRSPVLLSEADCAMHFARFLNKQGIAWRDIHLSVSPAPWLVETSVAGAHPPKIDVAIVDRDRLAKRKTPLRRRKQEEFLFDAVIEFTLAGEGRAGVHTRSIDRDTAHVRRYLDDLWARRGYVVVVEEADHGWEPPAAAPVDALSVHHLKCFQ